MPWLWPSFIAWSRPTMQPAFRTTRRRWCSTRDWRTRADEATRRRGKPPGEAVGRRMPPPRRPLLRRRRPSHRLGAEQRGTRGQRPDLLVADVAGGPAEPAVGVAVVGASPP